MLDLKQYAELVHKVRTLQMMYFQASAKARRSRLPEDFKISKSILAESKQAEHELDIQTNSILFGKEANNA